MNNNYAPVRVAKKYAQAFFKVFGHQITHENFEQLHKAADFFNNNKSLLFFLTLPALSAEVKLKALYQLFRFFKLDEPYTKLIDMLTEHKRAHVIGHVLMQLCTLYKEKNKILDFAITSSHKLSSEDIDALKQFLADMTKHDIIYTYSIDKNLIAGVRMQSDTLLWEHSIGKKLNQMRLAIIR